jgi:hypothetical protein
MPPGRSLVLGLVALLSLPLVARADVALSVGFSDPEFIAYFRQAILARTLPGHDDLPGRLARVPGPIQLLIINAAVRDDETLRPLFEQAETVAAQIHQATGRAVDVTRADDDAAVARGLGAEPRPNVILILGIVPFVDQFDPDMARRRDVTVKDRDLVTPCRGDQCRSAIKIAFGGGRDMQLALLRIDPADPVYARAAIAEGLLRAATDADAVDAAYPSALGWHRAAPFDRSGLSRMDRLMLHIVYDPRLHPGMTSAEIEALLPVLLADGKAAGTE